MSQHTPFQVAVAQAQSVVRSPRSPAQASAATSPAEAGFGHLVRDVSDRQLTDRQLAELAHHARLMMIGEMISGLAHGTNQPLGAAANYSRAGLRLARSNESTVGVGTTFSLTLPAADDGTDA